MQSRARTHLGSADEGAGVVRADDESQTVEAVRKNVLQTSHIPKVMEAWERRVHTEFVPRTACSPFNAFTQVQKSRRPRAEMEGGVQFSALVRQNLHLDQPNAAAQIDSPSPFCPKPLTHGELLGFIIRPKKRIDVMFVIAYRADMDKTSSVSDRIQRLRRELNLSQEALATRLGVSFATVNRWEAAKSKPQRAQMMAIEKLAQETGEGCTAEEESASRGGRRRRGVQKSAVLGNKGMEQMLWDAACSIRGQQDAPKFKEYILPLLFIKRLSDVFDDEVERLTQKFGDRDSAMEILEQDPSIVRFYLPPEARWAVVSGREKFDWPRDRAPKSLGEQLTTTIRAIVKENPDLAGVIDIVDYNETRNGEREISDAALKGIIETFSDPRYRLGLEDVEPDFLGRCYEYLLKKFAEGQGQSAGEFFTPTEVGFLIAEIMRPRPGEEAYDYACGSFGLLIKLQLVSRRLDPTSRVPLKLYGQELTGSSYAIACMNRIIHDMEGEVRRGDSMRTPKFRGHDQKMKKFDIVVSNPMWNQPIDPEVYEQDGFDRFGPRGGPTVGKADWAWLQHTVSAMKSDGRAAVVLDAAAVTRGSGSPNDRERAIRKWFIDHDLVDAVIQLPDNIFYNTTAAGILVVLRNKKPATRKGKITLIDASGDFVHESPKNRLMPDGIERIVGALNAGKDVPSYCKTISASEATAADYHLGPPRHVHEHKIESHHDTESLLEHLAQVTAHARELEETLVNRIKTLQKDGDVFPESGSWPQRPLAELVRIETGRTPSRAKMEYWKGAEGSGVPWVTISDMTPHGLIRSTDETVTQQALKEVFRGRVVKRGTLLMSFKLTIGRTATLDVDACHNEAIVAIYPGSDIDQKYLEYYLSQVDYRRYQDRAVKGNTLNLEKIARIEVIVPPLPVQRRIAETLAELHRALELADKRSSVLQDLFTSVRHDLIHSNHNSLSETL